MFPKKKPGMPTMFGKPKPKPDLSDPDSIDEKPMPKTPMAAHEAEESPDEESSEEYGAKLISDIEAVGEQHGLDSETTKSLAAGFFRAMADCLSGGGEEAGETAPDDESQEYGQ